MTASSTALAAVAATPVAAPACPVAAFRVALGQAAHRCGFAHAAYMHLGYRLPQADPNEGPGLLVSSGGLDEALYQRRKYLALDPLADRATTAFAPFAWSLDDLDGPAARPLARALDAWGVRSGLIAPTHDSAAGPAFVNFLSREPHAPAVTPESEASALLAAVRLHARARAELSGRPAADGALNPREMQVLRLAARGLTEVETAAQLRLSRRGVQFHLARAGAKLDTSNKTAAVARAISLGLIKVEGHKRSDKQDQ